MVSTLQQSIEFLKDFGMFDVVLPFLLVFAIVFAVLEKTMILGKEGNAGTKKNLNAIVALVMALITVATNQVVSVINEALPNIVLLGVVSISFLLLVGMFLKTGEFDLHEKSKKWFMFVLFLMFLGTVFIFASAIGIDGVSMLDRFFSWIGGAIGTSIVAPLVFLVIVVGTIYLVVRDSASPGDGGG